MKAIGKSIVPLTWTMLTCLVIGATRGDVLKYGTRLRPPPPLVAAVRNCVNCADDVFVKPDSRADEDHNGLGSFFYAAGPGREGDTQPSRSFLRTSKQPLVKTQQTTSPVFSEAHPKDTPKQRGATFFFTQVEPHRFEYRAMFQHRRDAPAFEPFVHDFDAFSRGFPPLPKLPDIFGKDPFPDINEFSFPTLPPSIKRIWQQTPREVARPQVPDIDKPDLGGQVFPKIFRFNDERVNIEHFDREKKLRFYSLGQNELLEPENVKRDQLLILHGGVFTVQEPPGFKKYPIKKRRKPFGLYHRPLRL